MKKSRRLSEDLSNINITKKLNFDEFNHNITYNHNMATSNQMNNQIVEERRNICKFRKPRLIQPQVIIKRQAPIKDTKFNSTSQFAYQLTSKMNEHNDLDQLIIFKNKKDAYLYFPFYWEDSLIEELVKEFIDRKLWSIDDEGDEVIFNFNKYLHTKYRKRIDIS